MTGHFNPQPAPTADDRSRADVLRSLLRSRLITHKQKKVAVDRQQHWTIEWTLLNLSHVSALIVLANHVKVDLSCVGVKDSLLPATTANFMQVTTNELEKVEGSYLYYDDMNGKWIRSGKVVGSSTTNRCIGMRNKEHQKSAELREHKDMESLFYMSYPSETVARTSDGLRRGFFKNLRLFVALGFLRTNATAVDVLVATSAVEGILCWPASTITQITNTNFRGVENLKDKQLHMVGYLFELCYELMLSPNDNVSQSPGFETCGLKVF